MPTVNSNGVNIYYEAGGQGEPLVLLQEFGHHSQHWGKLPLEFAKLYNVILIDNRGTGQSDKPDAPMTIAMMADDVCKVLDALSVKKANIFGASMGGLIAQRFALNHGDRVINLILGATFSGGPQHILPDAIGLRRLFDLETRADMTPEQRTREIFRNLCSDEFISQNPDAYRSYHQVTMECPTPAHTFKLQADAIMQENTWEQLPSLQVPTMIIAGTGDKVVSFKTSELLKAQIAGSELVLLQDKGHGFFIEGMDSTKIFTHGFIKRHAQK